MLRVVQAKGAGYAMSKQQELETMQHVAHATGRQCNVANIAGGLLHLTACMRTKVLIICLFRCEAVA